MTIVSATLLLYTSQLAQALNHPTHCRTTKSLSDYVLSGHTYKTTTGVTFERCTFNCEMDERCLSINYLPSTRICEYNNQTLELRSLNMVRREQWVYISSAVRGPVCNGPCAPVTGSLQSGWSCGSSNSATVINETCKGAALGMESGAIEDNQIRLSSVHSLTSSSTSGRANRPNSTWFPLTDDLQQWYQVTFDPQVKIITGVGTQGSDVKWNWIESYSVDYKLGGGQWMEYKENCHKKVFQGNTEATRQHLMERRVENPFKASAVRIRPITFDGRIALRVELFGCDVLP